MPICIRRARREDAGAIWRILEPTIRVGETYAFPRDMSEAAALAYWMGPDRETFVARMKADCWEPTISRLIDLAVERTSRIAVTSP